MSLPHIPTGESKIPKLKFSRDAVVLGLLSLTTVFSFGSCMSPGQSSGPASGTIYVQTADGGHLEAQKVSDNYRPKENVSKYAQRWLTLCWTWTQPAKEGAPNYVLDGNRRYPHSLYKCSMGIDMAFSQGWLRTQAKKYEKDLKFDDYINGAARSNIQLIKTSVIEKDGGWTVAMVANRIRSNPKGAVTAVEKFNRKLHLVPIQPVSKEVMQWGDGESQVAKNLLEMQSSGLLIKRVTEF